MSEFLTKYKSEDCAFTVQQLPFGWQIEKKYEFKLCHCARARGVMTGRTGS